MKMIAVFVVMAVVKWGDGDPVLLESADHFSSFDNCASRVEALEAGRPQNVIALVCGEKVIVERIR